MPDREDSNGGGGARLHVLLAEDSEGDAELALRELARAGYDVHHRRVESRVDLIAALEERVWDVVLSDFSMPSFDAFKAFRTCRERDPDLPFIIVSGTIGEEAAVRAMKEGVQDYLLKGNLTRLASAVEREIRESRMRRRARRSAAALAVEERRYRSIFNSASVSLWEMELDGVRTKLDEDGVPNDARLKALLAEDAAVLREVAAHGRVLDVNATTLALFGVASARELIGPLDRLLEFGLDDALSLVIGGLARGEHVVDGRVTARRADGTPLRILLSATLPPGEALRNVVVAMFDLTEYTKLEEQMRAGQRMEAVGRLAGGVAHDFNNLLTVILSHIAFVAEDVESESVKRDIEVVRDAASRATRLTRQFLALGCRQIQELRALDLNGSVRDLEDMLRAMIREDVELALKLAPGLPRVRADPTHVEQVLMNLAVNARDAMPGGGRLTIETTDLRVGARPGPKGPSAIPPGGYVLLAVTDTGTGMDAETRERIFEPFFTTKAARGTGLGLSTVYGIVTQAGGHVRVESEAGSGSRFEIYLPHAEPRLEQGSRAPGKVAPAGGSEVILLVDDDQLVGKATRRILVGAGYTVLSASSAEEALAVVDGHPGTIQLLLTDVVMPTTGGRELAGALAVKRPEVRVLFMSGYAADAIPDQQLGDEGAQFVQKPFAPQDLLAKVRSILDEPAEEEP